MGNTGIANIKILLSFILHTHTVGAGIFKGGHMDPSKLGELFTLLPEAVPAIGSIHALPAEFKDIDEAEGKELVALVAGHFGVADAHAIEIIDASLKVAFATYSLVKVIANKPDQQPS